MTFLLASLVGVVGFGALSSFVSWVVDPTTSHFDALT